MPTDRERLPHIRCGACDAPMFDLPRCACGWERPTQSATLAYDYMTNKIYNGQRVMINKHYPSDNTSYWINQSGGEGSVGTIVHPQELIDEMYELRELRPSHWVEILWDNKNRNKYHIGALIPVKECMCKSCENNESCYRNHDWKNCLKNEELFEISMQSPKVRTTESLESLFTASVLHSTREAFERDIRGEGTPHPIRESINDDCYGDCDDCSDPCDGEE